MTFDEETYAKVKPHFKEVLDHYAESGGTVAEMVRFLADRYGIGIRPYLKRFLSEQARNDNADGTQQASFLEANAIPPVKGVNTDPKPLMAREEVPMIAQRPHQETESSESPKWFNSPVKFHEGNIDEIRRYIPNFERRVFELPKKQNEQFRPNARLDTIVRMPIGEDKDFIPLGVVSKGYVFVPHSTVLDMATNALKEAKIALEEVKAELEITEYGERMALSLFFPDKYQFDPGDGNPMALRLECINSVDGSTRFRAFLGWFRFVCRNGLVIGVTRTDMHRRHIGDFQLDKIGQVLSSGLKESERDKKNFERWRKAEISSKKIEPWVEKVVRNAWGFKAAARTYHIARTGCDVNVLGPYKDNSPTTIPVMRHRRVPGSPEKCRNLFDMSQILAWLAKERRDLQEQMEWREQIPSLMEPLAN